MPSLMTSLHAAVICVLQVDMLAAPNLVGHLINNSPLSRDQHTALLANKQARLTLQLCRWLSTNSNSPSLVGVKRGALIQQLGAGTCEKLTRIMADAAGDVNTAAKWLKSIMYEQRKLRGHTEKINGLSILLELLCLHAHAELQAKAELQKVPDTQNAVLNTLRRALELLSSISDLKVYFNLSNRVREEGHTDGSLKHQPPVVLDPSNQYANVLEGLLSAQSNEAVVQEIALRTLRKLHLGTTLGRLLQL